jgi:hypothetical protein
LTPDAICSAFAKRPSPKFEVSNPYYGLYNSLLCDAFPIVQFVISLDLLDHGLDSMTLHLKTSRTTRKPVFILLIAPDNAPATRRDAEVTMLKLLKEAGGHGLEVTHGMCVCETQAALFHYDRERQIFLPSPQGQVNFDLNLATEGRAIGFLKIAEDVKRMCRKIIPDLEVPSYLGIPDPQVNAEIPRSATVRR